MWSASPHPFLVAVISTEQEGEKRLSRDPEDACTIQPIQGVLPRLCPNPQLPPVSPGTSLEKPLSENTSYRRGRGHIVGVSPLLRSRYAPSESVEMTAFGGMGPNRERKTQPT